MNIRLVGPAYDTNITQLSQQKCINWYIEGDLNDAVPVKYPSVLMPTPGITQLHNFDYSLGRASIVYRDIAYVVLDNMFAYLEEDGTPSYIDVLDTSTGVVTIAAAGDGILLADGDSAYFYSLTAHTFTAISDVDLPTTAVIGCEFYQGFHILIFADSEKFYYTTDPTTWDALDFMSVNSIADYITAVKVVRDELWFFGTRSTEVFYNSGDATDPLRRKPGIVLDKGCTAPGTIVPIEDAIHFLGTDNQGGYCVYQTQGHLAIPISTPAVATQIATYTTVDDAYAFGHRVGLHEFYVLTFPTENKTWAYDILTKQWAERMSIVDLDPFDPDGEPLYRAHRAKNHCFADGTHYVLDQYTGSIAKYDENVYTEYDMPIYRVRRTSQLSADGQTVQDRRVTNNQLHSYYNLVVNMEQGVGLTDGQGEDPQVMLNISTDGGHTWVDCGSRSIGAAGVYDIPIKWDILGQARDMVFEISVTDPVKAILLGGTVDMVRDSN